MLVLCTGVGSMSAYDEIYLRTDYKGVNKWGEDDSSYKFTYKETDSNNQDVYEMTINASEINTSDVWFRLHISGWDAQICPYTSNGSYTYTFTNGQNETYGAKYEKTYFQGGDYSFGISHSTIKARQYKITLFRGNNEQNYENENCRVMWIRVDIVSMPLTITSVGSSTFSSNRALDFSTLSASFTAKTITGAADGLLTTSSELGKVPATTGLFIEGTAGTYDVPVVPFAEPDANATAFTSNKLVGVTASTPISQTVGGNTNYIFTRNTANGDVATPKFYKVNTAGNTVPAGKAYLQIPTASAAPDFFWFDVSTPTNIDMVPVQENILQGCYNLEGQKVAQPKKGLYIVNGQKVFLK